MSSFAIAQQLGAWLGSLASYAAGKAGAAGKAPYHALAGIVNGSDPVKLHHNLCGAGATYVSLARDLEKAGLWDAAAEDAKQKQKQKRAAARPTLPLTLVWWRETAPETFLVRGAKACNESCARDPEAFRRSLLSKVIYTPHAHLSLEDMLEALRRAADGDADLPEEMRPFVKITTTTTDETIGGGGGGVSRTLAMELTTMEHIVYGDDARSARVGVEHTTGDDRTYLVVSRGEAAGAVKTKTRGERVVISRRDEARRFASAGLRETAEALDLVSGRHRLAASSAEAAERALRIRKSKLRAAAAAEGPLTKEDAARISDLRRDVAEAHIVREITRASAWGAPTGMLAAWMQRKVPRHFSAIHTVL
jgi:hypothetical protein